MRSYSAFGSWLLRTGAAITSSSGAKGALVVLMFHRVLHSPDPLLPDEPDAAAFRNLMHFLASHFNVLPLRDAVRQLRRKSLRRRTVCVTFDDGYANNLEVALPILRECGIPATVFVAPGFLGGDLMFNDSIIEAVRAAPHKLDLRENGLGVHEMDSTASRLRALESIIVELKHRAPGERLSLSRWICQVAQADLPTGLMMSRAQVAELHSAGVEIGAHTVTHPILQAVDLETARKEINDSKALLESIIKAPVHSFAYPNGRPRHDYGAQHVALVREAGFELALSTAWGAAGSESDVFQLPRIAPWDRSLWRYGMRIVKAYRQRTYQAA